MSNGLTRPRNGVPGQQGPQPSAFGGVDRLSCVDVLLADIADEPGMAAAAEMGDKVRYLHTDVTDDAAIDACISFAEETFGGLDFLVNLASTYLRAERGKYAKQR